jgi:drug/metabolite transporter (DMT)-like permease
VALPALFLLITMFFWGTAFRASVIAAEHASPVMVTALRAGLAAAVLAVLVVVLRSRLPPRELWVTTVVTGLLMVTLALEGITEGAARAGAGTAAIITNSSAFFVLVFERVFLRERMSAIGLGGLVVGFAGIVVMVWSQLGDIADTGDFVLGVCLSLAGAIGWAVGVLLTKMAFIRKPDLDMVGLTTGQYVVGGAAALALAFGLEGAGTTAWSSSELWGALAWIAIGASVIATLAYFGALKRMSATTVMAWQFLVPVVAVLTEIVYGNTPGTVVLVGMGIAIAGVAIVNVAPQLSGRLNERRVSWSPSGR